MLEGCVERFVQTVLAEVPASPEPDALQMSFSEHAAYGPLGDSKQIRDLPGAK